MTEAYLWVVYRIDKYLSIVPGEVSDHLGPATVREYCRDERDALVCGKGAVDKPFPAWVA